MRLSTGSRFAQFATLLLLLMASVWTVHAQSNPALLPAPLYYTGLDNQIYRLEMDGQRVRQVAAGIEKYAAEFDVSPTDGALVYVMNNMLVVADAYGNNPRILLQAGPLSLDENGYPTADASLSNWLHMPRWSPDASQIAFALGGSVYLIPAEGGASQLLLAADVNHSTRYQPNVWSPDGTRLAITAHYMPDGSGLFIIDPANPSSRSADYLLCCGATRWSLDGSLLYYSSAAFTFGISGLWQIDPTLPDANALIAGSTLDAPNLAQMVIGAQQLTDGHLYLFLGTFDYEHPSESGLLQMWRFAPDASNPTLLRSEAYSIVSDVLWALDGSGAVVASEQLLWLKTDNSQALTLAEGGHNLHWGLATTP